MRKTLFLLLLLCFNVLAFAQVPEGFNYQAIARDGTGNPITGQLIDVKIAILSDTITPVVLREELFTSVKTNAFGMFTLVIGTGAYQTGSKVKFTDIDWKAKQLFIRTKVNYNSNWRTMGSARLWSVPYSLIAKDLGGSLNRLRVAGSEPSSDSTLFEVRNTAGQLVFAVYNEGVRIFVNDSLKKGSTKGGFAIGGFGTAKGPSQTYFVVNPDSIRAYIASNPVKGVKGGFAIGGFDPSKSLLNEEYLRVTRDSSRIYIRNQTKGVKGGFAIGGFDPSKSGLATPFTLLYPDNYFIGHESGKSITSGLYNSFFGYRAGQSNSTGFYNVFIGHYSGTSNTTGWGNLFIGDSAGYQNISGGYNVSLGVWAGQENVTGQFNVNIGANAGTYNKTGDQNTVIGMQAGYFNTKGTRNTLIGAAAEQNNLIGSYNVVAGNYAGFTATSGDGNVYLGSYAGRNNLNGNWNVFIGYAAGRDELSSQRLYIANSATTSPLIYGEFDNGRVVINGNSAINVYGRSFFVNGTAGGSYPWFNDSDRKLKHDITTIPDALHKVLKIRGVNYLWNNPAKGLEGLQMGFIGQEVLDVVPEVVSVSGDHYSMQYAPITALLVEGMKEQQKQIESQQKEIDELKSLIKTLVANQAAQGAK